MTSQRIENAMTRIERALARIETQAALSAHAAPSSTAADTDLAARHEALREQVANSVAELDLLIQGIER